MRIVGRATRAVPACVLGLVTLSFGACGGGSSREDLQVVVDGPLITHDREPGEDAEIEGILTYVNQGECLVLVAEEDSSVRYAPVWPQGTVLMRSEGRVLGVEVPAFGEILVGQEVLAGGGYRRAGNVRDLPRLPDDCGVSEFAFIDVFASG